MSNKSRLEQIEFDSHVYKPLNEITMKQLREIARENGVKSFKRGSRKRVDIVQDLRDLIAKEKKEQDGKKG